jgi:type IV pilus assembly protein PilQ
MDATPNFAVNLPAATGAGAGGALGLTLGSIGGAANITLRLSAAEDEGLVKIVSAPKILTVDGKKATINQGVSIPISVVSANGVNTQFFQADLKLEVVTNTSPDGNIRMDIDITKNEPDFSQTAANGAPTITTKEAKTSLLVRDGDTTVIGGVYTQNKGSINKSVPFLSKIPLLGYLFQDHSETDKRSELLIFITPRIANRRASMVDSGGL